MGDGTTITALILDYGGVISQPQNPDNVRRMAELVNQDYDDFRRVYTANRPPYDSGHLSSDAYWRALLEQFGLAPTPSLIARLNQEDIESWTVVNESMVDFVRQNRDSVPKMAILSNMTRDTLALMRERFHWLDLFDTLTFSCELGAVKPHREIYRACLEALGLPASECLFVDDTLTNVKGAMDVGMAAIHFRDFGQFALDLARIGFPGAGPC